MTCCGAIVELEQQWKLLEALAEQAGIGDDKTDTKFRYGLSFYHTETAPTSLQLAAEHYRLLNWVTQMEKQLVPSPWVRN